MDTKIFGMIRAEAKLLVSENSKGSKRERRMMASLLLPSMIAQYSQLVKDDKAMKAAKGGVTSDAVLARDVAGKEWQYSNVRQTMTLVDLIRFKMILAPSNSQEFHRYQFFLKYGMYWSSGQRPDCFEPMQLRECYQNSFCFCRGNSDFAYVEGFYRMTYDGDNNLASHSWCADENFNMVDATYPAPNTCEYIGVPLNMEFVKSNFYKAGGRTAIISKDNDRVDMESIKAEEIIDSRFVDLLCGKAEPITEEIGLMQTQEDTGLWKHWLMDMLAA